MTHYFSLKFPLHVAALAVGLLGGCASQPEVEPETPADQTVDPAVAPAEAEAPTEATTAEEAPPEAWSADLSKEQKAAFMKAKVVPAMAPLFQNADPEAYADFGCQTCHGPEGKLPKEYLPELTLKDGKLTAFAEDPDTAKFMAEHVTPTMAGVLGMPPYDPATHTGFGCGGCHSIAMQ